MKRLIVVVVIGLALGLGGAWAQTYDIQKPVAKYGNLNQNWIPAPLGASACGPTAAVNSYVYLERQYPGIYGRKLVPDNIIPNGLYDPPELVAVAQTLALPQFMNTQGAAPGAYTGTFDDMFIYGKYQYIEDFAPGTTVYSAQLMSTWQWPGNPVVRPPGPLPPIGKPDWVQENTIPTWQFLYDELVACEDVEILIVDAAWGHFLTLTSFSWTDGNGNGVIDVAENATIDYIDPATGAWVPATQIKQDALGGVIWVNYPDAPNARLVMAVAESPRVIPEPAGLGLIAISLLAVRKRRR